jgi:hypothetical protein
LIIPKAHCPDCGGKLKLIALVKTKESIQEILTAMHLPTGPPKVVGKMGQKQEARMGRFAYALDF